MHIVEHPSDSRAVVEGVILPRGREPRTLYEGCVEFDERETETVPLEGLPVSIEHAYNDENYPENIVIGTVTASSVDSKGQRSVTLSLAGKPFFVNLAVNGVKTGAYKGLSLHHQYERTRNPSRPNEWIVTKTPIEVSICGKGKRPHTEITSMSINGVNQNMGACAASDVFMTIGTNASVRAIVRGRAFCDDLKNLSISDSGGSNPSSGVVKMSTESTAEQAQMDVAPENPTPMEEQVTPMNTTEGQAPDANADPAPAQTQNTIGIEPLSVDADGSIDLLQKLNETMRELTSAKEQLNAVSQKNMKYEQEEAKKQEELVKQTDLKNEALLKTLQELLPQQYPGDPESVESTLKNVEQQKRLIDQTSCRQEASQLFNDALTGMVRCSQRSIDTQTTMQKRAIIEKRMRDYNESVKRYQEVNANGQHQATGAMKASKNNNRTPDNRFQAYAREPASDAVKKAVRASAMGDSEYSVQKVITEDVAGITEKPIRTYHDMQTFLFHANKITAGSMQCSMKKQTGEAPGSEGRTSTWMQQPLNTDSTLVENGNDMPLYGLFDAPDPVSQSIAASIRGNAKNTSIGGLMGLLMKKEQMVFDPMTRDGTLEMGTISRMFLPMQPAQS